MSNVTADWLVWDAKAHLWWKPEAKGYTRVLAEAGRFTEADAIRHQMSSDLTSDRHDVAIPLSALVQTRGAATVGRRTRRRNTHPSPTRRSTSRTLLRPQE